MSRQDYSLPMPLGTYKWYILAFHILAFTTLTAALFVIYRGSAPPINRQTILLTGLIAIEGGLYIYTMILPHRWPLSKRLLLIYFGSSLAVWLVCALIEPGLWWVSFMYLGQLFGLLPMRIALPTTIGVMALMLWTGFDTPELIADPNMFFGLLMEMLAILLVLIYANHLIRSSQERGRLINKLQAAQQELEAAHQRDAELAVLRERERLARDLHDSLGHALVAISVQLEAIQRLYPVDAQAASDQIDQLKALTRGSMEELRRSLAGLRAPGLGDRSLSQAIAEVCTAYQVRTAQELTIQIDPCADSLSPVLAETCWRVVEETLTNIERHAQARHVQVRLFCQKHQLQLIVQDDGIGLPPDAENQPDHFGLRGMRERVAGLGGTLALENQDGLLVRVVIPLYTAG